MPASDPTDRRLRAAIYHLAHTYLEVERGLRDPEHLKPYLTPAEYRRHRIRPTHPRATATGAVLPTDIGHIHLDRHLPGQITATMPTRETDQRWGALVLHFARHAGQWRIDQLERLTRPGHLREPTVEPPEQDPLPQQIRQVTQERDLAAAAHRATTSRLADLQAADATPASTVSIRQLAEQQHTWRRHHQQLDDELTRLRETHQLRQQLGAPDPTHGAGDPATGLTHEQLLVALGPVPAEGWQSRLWHSLADEIGTYRQRWQVTDPRTVLGPDPDHPAHHHDRDELAATLRASARALGTAPPESHDRDRASQRDHARGLAAER